MEGFIKPWHGIPREEIKWHPYFAFDNRGDTGYLPGRKVYPVF